MKLAIYILTSAHPELALRALQSVDDQLTPRLNVVPYVMVNSLRGCYFDEVKALIGNRAKLINSESNGKPGKGKNACIAHAAKFTDAEYMMIIEGDDFLYPTALRMLAPLAKTKKYDVITGQAQDILLDGKIHRSWQYQQPNMAQQVIRDIVHTRDFNLWDTYSIDRLLLLKTSWADKNNIRFPEHMDLYEDWCLTITLTYAYQQKVCNYLMTNNSFIYAYDAGVEGQCSIFNKDRALAEWNMEKFWEYAANFAPVYFSKVPFRTLKHPFRFSHEKKERYIEQIIKSNEQA